MTGSPPTASRLSIAADLRRLGLESGDVVLFHSSLRRLGWVEGGADAVIDAFLDVVGPDGLVAVPTLTATFAPGCEFPDLVRHAFHPMHTPSRVGKITDTFWRRDNAYRSGHPTHSVAAIGPRAEEFVSRHDQTSTFGKDGPYGRYVEWGGKVLFLGVDLRSNTTLHAVEDWLDLPYLQAEPALVQGPDRKPKVVAARKSPMGDRDFYRRDSKVARLLGESGLVRRGLVGAAETLWLPARAMVEAVTAGLSERPDLLLCDRPECAFCTAWRQPTRDHLLRLAEQSDTRCAPEPPT